MKALKIILACLFGILAIFISFKGSIAIIKNMNSGYIPKNPVIEKKISKDEVNKNEISRENQDVDKMIFHSVIGTGETTLPVKYDKSFVIYENKFYVTKNKGKTWMQIPNDNSTGYAQISEYMNNISASNICIVNNKISIVYGGRGSENISIINSDSEGKLWSVYSISKTATHSLKNGYDKMYIDFLDGGKTGYIAAIINSGSTQENTFVFRSVNTGVTWDKVDNKDKLYNEILSHFGL